ncbi:MAG: MBOAT family protein [Oscillospiraceae bacterium]|jgi:alginate O-acetyltransferase complex protein AlgI|nr:MBOAT family protein [Oscillospiraceae bacterium]MCI8941924.1 MBOAT family protein [Oscillospiraceae bacterium]
MIFSSLPFLFFYLVAVLAVYKLSPLKLRNLILLVVSLFFYGWGEPVYIIIMLLSIVVDYVHGMLVERWREDDRKARRAVASSVFFNLAILVFFKYWDFIAGNLNALTGLQLPVLGLPLPIGISFYTFQTMSYTIDVYRQDAPVQKNPIAFGAYVTLFPQLIAGPIVRYKSVADQLEERREDLDKFVSGVRRFTVGAAKKVLLANAIGQLWDQSLASQNLTAVGAWLGLAAYAFQIYFDFSGYSDMAIGLGRMFGFEFLENFNYPYISRSVVEFWKRWHISLTTWFREYVYFPLGGNRVPKWKWIRNILIVWTLTGIWHGAGWNFLLWGLYYGAWMLAERLFLGKWLEKLPGAVRHIYTMFIVLIGWALFAVEDMGRLGAYFSSLFGGGGWFSAVDGYRLRTYLPTLVILIVGSTPLMGKLWDRLGERTRAVLQPLLVLGALILCTASLVDAGYNPFLYFRF